MDQVLSCKSERAPRQASVAFLLTHLARPDFRFCQRPDMDVSELGEGRKFDLLVRTFWTLRVDPTTSQQDLLSRTQRMRCKRRR